MDSAAEVRLNDVLQAAGVPDLLEILAERLSAVELSAVLRDACRRRAGQVTAAALLAQYEHDTHFRLSAANATAIARVDDAARAITSAQFELLDLPPICPSGTVSVLAPVDPGAAWGAGGGCEVVSDCRSVLALEAASRRRAIIHRSGRDREVRLCSSHRDLHAPFSAPLRQEYHSRVFGLCTAGAAEVAQPFEGRALTEQLFVHLRLLDHLRRRHPGIGMLTVALFHGNEPECRDTIRDEVIATIAHAFPDVRVVLDDGHTHRLGRGYCGPLGFTVSVEDDGEVEHWVGIGGFTDWTQQLLGSPTECLLVSTVAVEVLASLA